ncbi:MAG: TPM domain-containing protein [Clostridiales bacterium]|nr:TPM domain-containing protein [Clostridiales bacterium]
MKRKTFARLAVILWSLLIAVSLLPLPSFADGGFIITDDGFFTEDEINELNGIAQTIYDQTGIECFFAVTNSDPDIIDYADTLLDSSMRGENGMIMAVTDSSWYYVAMGDKAGYLSEDEIDALWDEMASDDNATYYDAVRDYFAYINLKMYPAIGVTANLSDYGIYNGSAIPDSRLKPLLVDNAGLLSSSEYNSLLAKLEEISSRQGVDVAVVTVPSLGDQGLVNFTDDFYDYNGYGQGSDRTGILLLLAMDVRKDHVTTTGRCEQIFSYDGLDSLMVDVEQNHFANDEWYDGFVRFADHCDTFITKYNETGEPYVYKTTIKDVLPGALLAAVGGGFLPALGVRKGMKNKMKSVRKAYGAERYSSNNGVQLYNQNDVFLFRNVSKTRHIEEDRGSGGGGGSHTHISSSGSSHGGRSGSF